MSPAAVSAWVKRGENHWVDLVASHGSSKRAKPDKCPKVNSYVVGYLDAMAHLPVSAPKATSWSILMGAAQEKAKEFARDQPEYGNFAASKGWLYALLRRHGYVRVKLCGEAGSVDQEAVKQKMIEFRLQLHETGVSNPKAIFNADETALFYQTIPNFMYTKDPSGEERGTSAMASKHRVTVLPCANACGDKLPVLVIGKSRSPRAFRGRQMPDSRVRRTHGWTAHLQSRGSSRCLCLESVSFLAQSRKLYSSGTMQSRTYWIKPSLILTRISL